MNVKYLKDKHLNPCDSYNLLNDENLDQNMHALSDQHSPLTGEEWETLKNDVFIELLGESLKQPVLGAESPVSLAL